jgi:hypothetical protein
VAVLPCGRRDRVPADLRLQERLRAVGAESALRVQAADGRVVQPDVCRVAAAQVPVVDHVGRLGRGGHHNDEAAPRRVAGRPELDDLHSERPVDTRAGDLVDPLPPAGELDRGDGRRVPLGDPDDQDAAVDGEGGEVGRQRPVPAVARLQLALEIQAVGLDEDAGRRGLGELAVRLGPPPRHHAGERRTRRAARQAAGPLT